MIESPRQSAWITKNVLSQQVAVDLRPLDDDVTLPFPDHIPAEFTIDQDEVERKLSEINICKAPGPDGLPNWVLPDFSAQLAGLMCAIYNAPVREGIHVVCASTASSPSAD